MQKDLTRISETQLQIENNSIKEAQKGLNEQKQRYQQLERETDQLRKRGAISKAEANERKGIVKDLKAQRKAQQSAFNKQFQKGLYSPGLQNAAFTAPFVLSMAQGFIPEGRGGTAQGVGGGALAGAASGGALGSVALLGGVNPATIAIGLTATALGAVYGAVEKLKPSVEELTAKFKNEQAELTGVINSSTQYVKIQEQLNNALDSGDINRQQSLMEDLSSTLTEIVDPNVRNQLIQAGDDIGKLGKS